MDKVLIINSDYEKIEKDIERVFDLFPLDVKGKKVLVKPNILGPFKKERHITTHPSLVRAVISHLEKKDAEIIVGDNPGFRGFGMNEKSAAISGILDAAGKYYKNIGKDFKKISVESKYFSQAIVSKDVLDCDVLISLPKFKTHINTKITGGVKNMYGILGGSEKERIHRIAAKPRQFAEAVVDIYQIKVPDLVIMDAVMGMQGDGPNSKDLRKIGKIIASNNAVCLDAVMAEMMGMNPADIDLLRIANERGLGSIDINEIDIIGKLEKIPNFKLPINFTAAKGVPSSYNLLVHLLVSRIKLVIDAKKCKKCHICMNHCPVDAISENKNIDIDNKKCIKCYCCKELCPHDAIRAKGLIETIRRIIDR